MNKRPTIMRTKLEIKLMTSFRPVGEFPPEKATATFPITNEMDGRMAPAMIEADVPITNRILSVKERKLKNFKKEI
jgi:hypothetical protein